MIVLFVGMVIDVSYDGGLVMGDSGGVGMRCGCGDGDVACDGDIGVAWDGDVAACNVVALGDAG